MFAGRKRHFCAAAHSCVATAFGVQAFGVCVAWVGKSVVNLLCLRGGVLSALFTVTKEIPCNTSRVHYHYDMATQTQTPMPSLQASWLSPSGTSTHTSTAAVGNGPQPKTPDSTATGCSNQQYPYSADWCGTVFLCHTFHGFSLHRAGTHPGVHPTRGTLSSVHQHRTQCY